MRYNGVRLEKGMYQEYGRTFSHVLESIDPSNQYVGTPLEGLDAFQRQLKRFDIKVKGAQSDTVEKFFATTESAVLFPEYVARVVQRGMEESDIVPMITASVTKVDDEEQVGNTRANLRKRGRLLVPEGQLRHRGPGRHYGPDPAVHYPGDCVLPHLPEAHHRGRSRWRGEGLSLAF